ncbi:MAG TPA: reverse transcriptase family protein [Chitinophagales bacterium]|nr:reverse transcriptase family protein [Chitinophagales bacterium]
MPLDHYKPHEINALHLLSIRKSVDLCKLLDTDFFSIEEQINQPTYYQYYIPKKKGGKREILAPEFNLKLIQRCLNDFLQSYYLCIKPKEVYGFIIRPDYIDTRCNIVENARKHVGKKQVLNIDLKDFFPSITAKRVRDLFVSPYFNFNENIAIALTLLTTYQGKLPTGAPTSPVISNFICIQLDSDLRAFCQENNLTYTRYADDLTFSSDLPISSDQTLDIINIIRKNHFGINDKKLRLKSPKSRQIVTGLTVNEKVNVDRKLLKKVRAMLHDFGINGLELASQRHFKNPKKYQDYKILFIYRLQGYINFIGQVRGKSDPIYIKYKTVFDSLFEPNAKGVNKWKKYYEFPELF